MINVIYFNQWFSSITPVIEDIKKKMGNKIKIIASSKNPEHAYKNVVDEFLVENWEDGDSLADTNRNYIEYTLNVCKNYNVDIFFVKKNSKIIAENADKFKEIGVELILEDYSTLNSVKSKSEVYDLLYESFKPEYKYLIPNYFRYRISGNKDDQLASIRDILYQSDIDELEWCLKLDEDEGGASFRKIKSEKILDLSSLSKFRVNEITVTELNKMVDNLNEANLSKLLFMEILDEPEISVDCYNSKHGFIAICREKLPNSRVQRIYFNKEVTNICKSICELYDFKYPFNVQFRTAKGTDSNDIKNLRLLEINPRMSGGTYYSTLYNMNIAEQVLLDEMGISKPSDFSKFVDFTDKRVTFVEQAIKLD